MRSIYQLTHAVVRGIIAAIDRANKVADAAVGKFTPAEG